jgi:chromodomain-helicase-DNA-binding protein 1
MDEAACKEEMRPVKQQLVSVFVAFPFPNLPFTDTVPALQRRLKTGTDDLPREEKLAVLKECLSVIGRRIDIVVADKRHAGMDADKWRKHLWV